MLDKNKLKLEKWKANALLRTRHSIRKSERNTVIVENNSMINFCSNDYLGLSKNPQIIEAYSRGIDEYGLGSGASAFISGYYSAQNEFEIEFANWLGVEKAILFSSGYLANIGTITALVDRKNSILSDKFCHASILDGIQLSRAKHFRYQHNSLIDLIRLAQLKKPDLIITESVFSMKGSISPISEITSLANYHQSMVVVDDAHGIGVLGKWGRGICEHAKINPNQIDCLVAPLGKAFNAMGAMVAGKKEVIETVLQFARTYRYTTALPPAIACALLITLRIVSEQIWRREKLIELTEFFISKALARGLNLSSLDPTPIKSIIIGNNIKVLELQKIMLTKGFFVSCIRPPTVPDNQACIRISLNCMHQESDIVRLIDSICESII